MTINSALQVDNKNLIVISQNRQTYKNQIFSFRIYIINLA